MANCSGVATRSTVTAFITWASDVPANAAGTDCDREEGPPPSATRRSCARRELERLCKNASEGVAGRPVRLTAKRTAAATSGADPMGKAV